MKLIVGLGNPGTRYTSTRHNAGFMVIDRLAERHAPGAVVKSRFKADGVEAPIASTRCLLLKPMTYMNLSGESVIQAVQFYKVPLGDVLVITDDLALPVGSVRLRPSGGSGGHNGLSDIERRAGSSDYPRCRVGIGPKPPMFDQAAFVLSRFAEEERDRLETSIRTAADAVETFVASGIDAAMNQFNSKIKPGPGPGGDADPEADAGWGAA